MRKLNLPNPDVEPCLMDRKHRKTQCSVRPGDRTRPILLITLGPWLTTKQGSSKLCIFCFALIFLMKKITFSLSSLKNTPVQNEQCLPFPLLMLPDLSDFFLVLCVIIAFAPYLRPKRIRPPAREAEEINHSENGSVRRARFVSSHL